MSTVRDWLTSSLIFLNTAIDGRKTELTGDLPDLTDQDLEKLGVVLGDRRKILRATGAAARSPERRNSRLMKPPNAGKSIGDVH